MSFTSAIKSELCRLELGRDCCVSAELAALVATRFILLRARGNVSQYRH